MKKLLACVLGIFGATHGLAADPVPAAKFGESAVADVLTYLQPGAVKMGGRVGAQIELCLRERIAAQNVGELIAPFQARRDLWEWRSEFWGKWCTSAVAGLRYSGDEQLQHKVAEAVRGLLATQGADGYIGTYPDYGRLQRWDLWGRKYTLLGLLDWHELTGDPLALAAARREADLILNEVGPGRASPTSNDMWNGMASSSIIEPMVLLYRRTGDPRYLAFVNYLLELWPTPVGPDLLNKALAGVPVFAMFPGPSRVVKNYFDGGQSKAYEMMSCFEGLAELYRSTGRPEYLEAVRKVQANVRDTEITIIGSGSDWERWCDGHRRQTEPWVKGMETCVGVTWMKLNAQLLRVTGEAGYADEIERTMYNTLLGAQGTDGAWWCDHTPLAGIKTRAPEQCDMNQHCCVANGPRGLMLLPKIAVMNGADGPVINLYAPMQATVELPGGGSVALDQQTGFPLTDTILITVRPDVARNFTLSLRLPAWSAQTVLTVNGQSHPTGGEHGYLHLKRQWQPGDVVSLKLDLRARAVPAPGDPTHIAILRGPIVLARDQRLDPPNNVDRPVALKFDAGGWIATAPVQSPRPENIWQVFAVPLAKDAGPDDHSLLMCDVASAGNTWTEASRYRVWLPKE